jgi:mannose-6-phosphate isomerase-like protein (cupin superfamily)
MLHERYQPGAHTGRAMLSHDGEECGIVVRGRIELTVNSKRHVLKAGDGYYFDSSRPHRFRNTGNEVCEIVSACSKPSL